MGTTTSRLLLFLVAAGAWGQSAPAAPTATVAPLPWAVAEFSGGGDWAVRLPQLLVRGWTDLPAHRYTAAETEVLTARASEAARLAFDAQEAQLRLALDQKRLAGLPATEPAATEAGLADVAKKRATPLAAPAATAPLQPVWPTGNAGLPWPAAIQDRLLTQTKATYLVTGTVRLVGTYLRLTVQLYSTLEDRVLARWQGQCAPDEAPAAMAAASDTLREALLGRPWAGLLVTGPASRILVQGVEHAVPWSTDDLEPGSLDVTIVSESGNSVVSVPLEAGRRTPFVVPDPVSRPTLELETDPPGASVYLDSRYLGSSPQTIDRPAETTRIRVQSPGWATAAWEVGPATPSPLLMKLELPRPQPSVPDTKDRFYWSLAAFSASLTTTVFLGAWRDEQVQLVNAYALAGATEQYQVAYQRFQTVGVGYGTGIALTSTIFVWMMFELGNYLAAAESSLP